MCPVVYKKNTVRFFEELHEKQKNKKKLLRIFLPRLKLYISKSLKNYQYVSYIRVQIGYILQKKSLVIIVFLGILSLNIRIFATGPNDLDLIF